MIESNNAPYQGQNQSGCNVKRVPEENQLNGLDKPLPEEQKGAISAIKNYTSQIMLYHSASIMLYNSSSNVYLLQNYMGSKEF